LASFCFRFSLFFLSQIPLISQSDWEALF
jgi:hypothetical protein